MGKIFTTLYIEVGDEWKWMFARNVIYNYNFLLLRKRSLISFSPLLLSTFSNPCTGVNSRREMILCCCSWELFSNGKCIEGSQALRSAAAHRNAIFIFPILIKCATLQMRETRRLFESWKATWKLNSEWGERNKRCGGHSNVKNRCLCFSSYSRSR